jgi:glycosyltransferase involved in cell wall biosynthesis
MKIMFLLNDLSPGGAERVTTTLANHWAQAGHEVTLVTMARGDDFYPLDPRVDRRRFDLSAPSRSLPMAVAGGLRRVSAVRGLLRGLKPDVAVAMMTSWNVELALAASGLSVVAVGSERIYPPSLPLGRVWEMLRRWLYGSLDAVVAQTEASRDWLLTHTRARQVYVIPNPIPAFGGAPAPPPDQVPLKAPLLLAVGRLVRQKRFDRVIDAFASERAAFSGWHLVIVGEGDLREDLLRHAADAGLANRVHFPGSSAEIDRWYRRADMFVLSSDFEGFPNVLLEAMSHGLPSIAVDCPSGPAELIDHGRNGLIVPLGEQQALAHALAALARDEVLRQQLGQAARRDTVEKYSAGRIAAQWEAVFASVKEARD